MNYNIRIYPEAVQDIDQAFAYYSEFSISAIKSFEAELANVFEALETNPFYQLRYKNLHGKPFKSLPYL